MEKRIDIVGIGPGRPAGMTLEAKEALERADVIVGYTGYIRLLEQRFLEKELLDTPMRGERERCRMCFARAQAGKRVALVCSGDPGIYGLASLMYEMGREYRDVSLSVVPGVTAASSGAAVLGAPLNHDFCTVSLSDLLTPWETIERRLKAAAEGDFVIVLYNPASHKRKGHLARACDILLQYLEEERPCGYVENIGREGERAVTCTLRELKEAQANMFTTVYIGNRDSFLAEGKLITKRGYQLEGNTDLCGNHGGTGAL